ncbi:hypothetical protein [Hoeflea sp.]|uniref:hypothetical protein n=1 Tax=Hoeflea sp. TaxID=1940281 RepID=UPI003B011512
MGKPYNAGIAASNGVEAALLAKAGFVSQPDGLECQQGFADTHAGAFRDQDKVLEGLGEAFVFEAVQHKFHACCHGLHAMLEAISELQDPPEPESIAEVVITTNPQWLRVCNIAEPRTGLEAKFSYRLTAAMALGGVDTGDLKSFTDEVCSEERLLRLRDRVRVETDDQIPDTAARVSIALESGAALSSAHDLSAPLPVQLREDKIRAKAEKLLGGKASSELWRIVDSLDTDNLDDFADFLARQAP